MASPDDRRYLKSHEWHKLEADGLVTIGISKFAVEELTDITFVDLPRGDGEIAAGETFGEVESVKATSELYCGIDGTIEAVNQAVLDQPELLNDDSYEQGWMIKVRPSDPAQLEKLMGSAEYDQACGGSD